MKLVLDGWKIFQFMAFHLIFKKGNSFFVSYLLYGSIWRNKSILAKVTVNGKIKMTKI